MVEEENITLSRSSTPTSATAAPKVPSGALKAEAATSNPEDILLDQPKGHLLFKIHNLGLTAIRPSIDGHFALTGVFVLD